MTGLSTRDRKKERERERERERKGKRVWAVNASCLKLLTAANYFR